jgi:DNA-binding GntR family transcriptional regulator
VRTAFLELAAHEVRHRLSPEERAEFERHLEQLRDRNAAGDHVDTWRAGRCTMA